MASHAAITHAVPEGYAASPRTAISGIAILVMGLSREVPRHVGALNEFGIFVV